METPNPNPPRSSNQNAGLVAATLLVTFAVGLVGLLMLGFSTLGCRNVSGVNMAIYTWLALCLGIGVYTAIRFVRQKSKRTTLATFALLVGLNIVALLLSFGLLVVACG